MKQFILLLFTVLIVSSVSANAIENGNEGKKEAKVVVLPESICEEKDMVMIDYNLQVVKLVLQRACSNWEYYDTQTGPNGEVAYRFRRLCCNNVGTSWGYPGPCEYEYMNTYPEQ
jgi:hypothetical protein